MSSPNTSVRGSASSASASARLSAATIVISPMFEPPISLPDERVRRRGEDVVEHLLVLGRAERDQPCPDLGDPGLGILLDLLHRGIVDQTSALEEPAVTVDPVPRP